MLRAFFYASPFLMFGLIAWVWATMLEPMSVRERLEKETIRLEERLSAMEGELELLQTERDRLQADVSSLQDARLMLQADNAAGFDLLKSPEEKPVPEYDPLQIRTPQPVTEAENNPGDNGIALPTRRPNVPASGQGSSQPSQTVVNLPAPGGEAPPIAEQAETASTRAEADELRRQLDIALGQTRAMRGERDRLAQRNTGLLDQITSLDSRLSETILARDRLQAELGDLQARLADQTPQSAKPASDTDSPDGQQQQQIALLEDNNRRLGQEIAGLQSEIQRLRSVAAQARQAAQGVKANGANSDSNAIAALQARLNDRDQAYAALQNRCAALQARLSRTATTLVLGDGPPRSANDFEDYTEGNQPSAGSIASSAACDNGEIASMRNGRIAIESRNSFVVQEFGQKARIRIAGNALYLEGVRSFVLATPESQTTMMAALQAGQGLLPRTGLDLIRTGLNGPEFDLLTEERKEGLKAQILGLAADRAEITGAALIPELFPGRSESRNRQEIHRAGDAIAQMNNFLANLETSLLQAGNTVP